MKTFSIMETQHNLSKVLREVEQGREAGITRRNKLVARILPVEDDTPVSFPDFAKRNLEIWGDTWSVTSSDEALDTTRGER